MKPIFLRLSARIAAAIAAVRGVGDERRAQQMAADLTAAVERFRDFSQMGSDWFWEQDAHYRFTSFSDSMHRHTRIDAADLIGKTRWELPIDIDPAVMAAHRQTVEAHQPFRDFEFRIGDASGDLHWFSTSGKPLFDAAGKFLGYRGTSRDISAQKKLEQELRTHRDNLSALVEAQTVDLVRAKEAAEHASRGKSAFLANMSHELRTPMHAILSFARIGQSKAGAAPPEKIREYFDRIHASGERLLELVGNLLDLSKLEAGKMNIEQRRVDLAQIAQEVVHDLEGMLEARHQQLLLSAAECGTEIVGDGVRLAQVIRNLVSNAIKFTPEGRCIRIEFAAAELPGGRRAQDCGVVPALAMTVADEGIGIPDSELETIFDKFHQSSLTRTGAGGTGLGLSICREIVLAHRGTIRAHNRVEGGAAFEVILPKGTL